MKYGAECSVGTWSGDRWYDYPLNQFEVLPTLRPALYPDGDDCWILNEDFSIRVKDNVYTIKAGFDFDGASIPRRFWNIVGHPMGVRKMVAAMIHDAAYASHIITRKEADKLFMQLLKAYCVGLSVTLSCYTAVAAFGWTMYPKTDLEIIQYSRFVSKCKVKQDDTGKWTKVEDE